MTTNTLRLHIISRILRMNRAQLLTLQSAMGDIRRSAIPSDLPEWMSSADAADILHLTPRHIRRLARSMLPGLMCLRPGDRNSKSWFIHRDLILSIANAPSRAIHAPSSKPKCPLSDISARTCKNLINHESDH